MILTPSQAKAYIDASRTANSITPGCKVSQQTGKESDCTSVYHYRGSIRVGVIAGWVLREYEDYATLDDMARAYGLTK